MVIIVDVINWKDIDVNKIARTIKESQTLNSVQERMSINQIEVIINKYFMNDDVVFFCAKNDDIILGFLVLYASDNECMEINPGMTLGGHPVIIRAADWRQILKMLINKAINWSIENKVNIIELTIPWKMEINQEIYENYISSYNELGLIEKLRYIEMENVLDQQPLHEIILSKSINIKSITNFTEEELYQCYYTAFKNGDAKFFYYQEEGEKSEYFKELGYPNDLDSLTSIAFIMDNKLIGFSIVLPFSEEHFHISCMCVSPQFTGKGHGKMMLFYILNELKTRKAQKVTLGTEPGMKAFKMYQKYGFEITEGFVIFRGEVNKKN